MWFIISIIIIIIFLIWITKNKRKNRELTVSISKNDNSLKNRPKRDFELWESILKKEKKNLKHFELFGTKAAVLWNDGEDEIEIICLNRFINGKPDKGSNYDYYGFNIKGWYWTAYTPQGVAEKIKEEIQILFNKESLTTEHNYQTFKNRALKEDNPKYFEEFTLFDSKALIWYVPERSQIRILCPHRFTKGIASKAYMHFNYDASKKQWVSSNGYPIDDSPKGCKEQIISKIEEFYKKLDIQGNL